MNAQDFSYEPDRKLLRRCRGLAATGILVLAAGMLVSPQRAWLNFLLVSYYLLGAGLAGLVWIALQYVSGANWSTALRRVPEALSGVLPMGVAGILLLLIFHPRLYPWVGGGGLAGFKHWWLTLPFVRLRAVVYLAGWLIFAAAMVRASRRQDANGDLRYTRRNIRLSAAFLVLFAVTFWLASSDWIMSLEPQWYSTIFGFYNFAGLFLSGLALITLALIWLRRHSPLRYIVTNHHLHDLGKLLFAFSTFWAYLWFSQYMLIWYANLPDETAYYLERLHGYWQPLFVLNLALNWVVPFFALLPRSNKQNPGVLVKVCLVVLAGRWLDLYLMIMPAFSPVPRIGLWELGAVAALLGVFALAFFAALRHAALIPLRDPYLSESLHHHA
ncbi:MAG TPA: hypothetical protein VJQ50_22215 [Terriglobales bacterium]|nr:hypothetical protein [Terriglobales bacterium]